MTPVSDKKRYILLVSLVIICFLSIVYRLCQLSIGQRHFLQQQADRSTLRLKQVPALRGDIFDRQGKPLAMSILTDSIAIHPYKAHWSLSSQKKVAKILGVSSDYMHKKIKSKQRFVYLRRRVSPSTKNQIDALELPGVVFLKEPKRYYPLGKIISPLLGFTGIGDRGLEGLELAYNHWLSGHSGLNWVEQDPSGHILSIKKTIRASQPGHPITLSVDRRLQAVAYHALAQAVKQGHAAHGSAVVLSRTGEVLALANYPSFNPNHLVSSELKYHKNHALLDVYEPGSGFKPITMASLLQHHYIHPWTSVFVGKGRLTLNGHTILDSHAGLNKIDASQVIQYSSNVGIAKLALTSSPNELQQTARQFGFGHATGSGFPGERAGQIKKYIKRGSLTHASFAFGYGVTATNLQMAQAYLTLANRGVSYPITFLKRKEPVKSTRVISQQVSDQIIPMLQKVVTRKGTGYRASVPGVLVAGKTGTAHLVNGSGYDQHNHLASFVGFAPVKNPRLIVAVFIVAPDWRHHFGGVAAAPVFANIVKRGLRFVPKLVE